MPIASACRESPHEEARLSEAMSFWGFLLFQSELILDFEILLDTEDPWTLYDTIHLLMQSRSLRSIAVTVFVDRTRKEAVLVHLM